MGSLSFALLVFLSLVASLIVLYLMLFKYNALNLGDTGWAKVDYAWLGIVGLSVVLGSGQYYSMVQANEDERIRLTIGDILYDIEREADRLSKECDQPDPSCDLYGDIEEAIRETQFRSGIMPGEIHFNGLSYRSLNQLIRDRAQSLGVDKISISIIGPSTQVLDLAGKLNARAIDGGRKSLPTWLAFVWPILLAVSVSLRIVKAVRSVHLAHEAA